MVLVRSLVFIFDDSLRRTETIGLHVGRNHRTLKWMIDHILVRSGGHEIGASKLLARLVAWYPEVS